MKEQTIDDFTQQDFIEQMETFQFKTAKEILDILEKEEFILPVVVLGLTSIIRALVNEFGNDELMEEVVHYLTLKDVNVMEDNNKEED